MQKLLVLRTWFSSILYLKMELNKKNLNLELYSGELLESWTAIDKLIPAESYLLKKYLTNKNKNVLEAGTGGGRIAFHIEEMGFNQISAFDFSPNMISKAREKASHKDSKIVFAVEDATKLNAYRDHSFDYLIYLQQVLCFIDSEELFKNSLKESYRVAKKDAVVIFSFLDYDSRIINPFLSIILTVFRILRGEKHSRYYLPWLKINNAFNRKIFHKNQPVTFWVKKNAILKTLKDVGFSIVEARNANQLNDQKSSKRVGMLYVVCKK